MMISKEELAGELRKQEIRCSSTSSAAAKTTTSSSWTRLKDPRIVRVSRALGGKDRHSKVCTVKGLRDRRVRLSVPTAIQLYDLQDRLGLNQPSKVVDWLLDAAKNEIDELPPLQFPPGSTSFPMIDDPKQAFKMCASSSINWNINQPAALDGKCKDDHRDRGDQDHCNWGNQQEYSYVSSNQQQDSYSYNNNNSFARWDPSNLTLSHQPSRSHGLSPHHHDEWPNFNLMVPLQPSGSHHPHQVLVYQHGMSSTQSYFPDSQIGGTDSGIEAKQMNYNNQTTSPPGGDSATQPAAVRQLHFNMMTANLLPSQDDDDDES